MEHYIIHATVGSHSVGVATPESDIDQMAVVIAPKEHYLGLDYWGQQGTKEFKTPDPTTYALVETTCYELTKFLRLCAGFNPNVIPLLWLREDMYNRLRPAGKQILESRHLFNSKKAYYAFAGYMQGQIKKMGELGLENKRMTAQRKELRAKFGYDTKYAYHAVRLVRMLDEFLSSKGERLSVNRVGIDADELLAIRNGALDKQSVQSLVEKTIEECKHKTDWLPEEPDWKGINALSCKILEDALLRGEGV